MCGFSVGDIIFDLVGYSGTVHFVGTIPKSGFPNTTWVGVEWNDPARGKYDGSIYGERYFTCAPGAGSFVRPSKIVKGLSVADAVSAKYTDTKHRPYISVSASYLVERENGDSGPFIRLLNVDMSTWPICHAGSNLSSICPNIMELNLANTHLKSWDECLNILKHLQHLTLLNLSNNQLGPWCAPASAADPTNVNLSTLILNGTQADWATVDALLRTLPGVGQLHLAGNALTDVSLPPDSPLALLNLADNQLGEWAALACLGRSPRLHTLLVSGNPLGRVDLAAWYPSALPDAAESALAHLSLDNTHIADWASIDQLALLPSLEELSCNNLPVFKGLSASDRRSLLIARLPAIKKLNRSPIGRDERERAHRFFVRHYARAADPPERYFSLRLQYGDLQPLADISLEPEPLHLEVLFEDKPCGMYAVNPGWTLEELLAELGHILQRAPSALSVYHKAPYDTTKMQGNSRRIFSWRVADGDELHVFGRPPRKPRDKNGTTP